MDSFLTSIKVPTIFGLDANGLNRQQNRDRGGDLMCIFSSVAASSKWGSWGLLEDADENSAPKFDAIMEWKRTNMP